MIFHKRYNPQQMLNKEELEDICKFVYYVHGQEPLDGDDLEDIMRALRIFNGEDVDENGDYIVREGDIEDEMSRKIKDVMDYIVETEMEGRLDEDDSYYTCWYSLRDLEEKIEP
tara:strand:- start:975 stop:1316 length:342 start_codon:yes stop_codon:yes gene_type:complete